MEKAEKPEKGDKSEKADKADKPDKGDKVATKPEGKGDHRENRPGDRPRPMKKPSPQPKRQPTNFDDEDGPSGNFVDRGDDDEDELESVPRRSSAKEAADAAAMEAETRRTSAVGSKKNGASGPENDRHALEAHRARQGQGLRHLRRGQRPHARGRGLDRSDRRLAVRARRARHRGRRRRRGNRRPRSRRSSRRKAIDLGIERREGREGGGRRGRGVRVLAHLAIPVRMYLRKMGSVSLLTREGEVEIAKRIEDGERKMLQAVLNSHGRRRGAARDRRAPAPRQGPRQGCRQGHRRGRGRVRREVSTPSASARSSTRSASSSATPRSSSEKLDERGSTEGKKKKIKEATASENRDADVRGALGPPPQQADGRPHRRAAQEPDHQARQGRDRDPRVRAQAPASPATEIRKTLREMRANRRPRPARSARRRC